MNRIVREHYPVADLPEDLRSGLPSDAVVRVTVEAEFGHLANMELLRKPTCIPSIKELLAMRRPPYKSTEQIVAEIREMRDEWDD